MIETVFSAALPVGENLIVQRNRIVGIRRGGPRVAVVTGMHGDELEGQLIAYELTRRLNERPEEVRGTIDVYPALNPLGLSANTHGIPMFDIDLDRTFPGDPDGNLAESLAAAILNDIQGSTACVIVHSSSASMLELAQIRIDERESSELMRLASLLNVRLVWVRPPTLELKSTLAHMLNRRGTPTLVVEIGSGMRVSQNRGDWLVDGILRLLEHLHAWSGPTLELPNPYETDGSDVASVVASKPGLFLSRIEHGSAVSQGQMLGVVVDPLRGQTMQEVIAPCDGLLFSLRVYPIVHPGSLLVRVLEGAR